MPNYFKMNNLQLKPNKLLKGKMFKTFKAMEFEAKKNKKPT